MALGIVHPLYFGPIDLFVDIAKLDTIWFETHDNYQKQTYRTRQYIYGANGKLLLNIPIKHTGDGKRQLLKEIKIESAFKWQLLHWRSLEAAYRTSPFFEYFEDDLYPLYHTSYLYLIDFTMAAWDFIIESLGLEIACQPTTQYQETYPSSFQHVDLRNLAVSKRKVAYELPSYTQVFESKAGFINNLSILDLLFNEGTNALNYLKSSV